MGITNFSVQLLDKVIDEYKPKAVIELGSQQTYVSGDRYGQFANWYYESKGIENYKCIDLNGENNAWQVDLSKPDVALGSQYPLVTNFGTSEHVGKEGKFDWGATYNCFKTIHDLCEIGGIIVNENPKTQNWHGHGFAYMTQDFYNNFVKVAGYELLDLGEHAACNNFVDGWNVYATLRKTDDRFPTVEQFSELGIQQS